MARTCLLRVDGVEKEREQCWQTLALELRAGTAVLLLGAFRAGGLDEGTMALVTFLVTRFGLQAALFKSAEWLVVVVQVFERIFFEGPFFRLEEAESGGSYSSSSSPSASMDSFSSSSPARSSALEFSEP